MEDEIVKFWANALTDNWTALTHFVTNEKFWAVYNVMLSERKYFR